MLEISPKKFDEGRVILQENVSIDPHDTYSTLKSKLIGTATSLANSFIDHHGVDNFAEIKSSFREEEKGGLDPRRLNSYKLEDISNIFRFNNSNYQLPVSSIYNKYRAFTGTQLKTLRLSF